MGHDKLCCVKAPHCRYCPVLFPDMDRYVKLAPTNMSRVKHLAHGSDRAKKELSKMGYHVFKKNAFFITRMSDPVGGIHQSCPAELLHQYQQGLDKYALGGFFNMKYKVKKVSVCRFMS